MSLLLDALKKAALEKQKAANINAQCLDSEALKTVSSAEDDETPNEVEASAVEEATIDAESAEAISLELELQESDSDRELSESLEFDASHNNEIDSDFAIPESASLDAVDQQEYGLEDGFGDSYEEESQPTWEAEAQDTVEELPEETVPKQMDYQSASDFADEILAEFGQLNENGSDSAAPTIPNNSDSTNHREASSNAVVSQEDIDAMIDGAYSASSSAKADTQTSETKGVERKSEEEISKEALTQLIESTSSSSKNDKKRQIALIVILLFVALGLGGAYYYFEFNTEEMMPMPVRQNYDLVETETEGVISEGAAGADLATGEEVKAQSEMESVSSGTFVNKPAKKLEESTAKSDTDSLENSQSKPQSNNLVPMQPKIKSKPKPVAKKQPRPSVKSAPPKQDTIVKNVDNRSPLERSLDEAYLAYHQNQIPQAKVLYQYALRLDPKNRDALLGVAAVSTKLGDYETALSYYQSILLIDPADDIAQAGLLQISSQQDAIHVESQLKLFLEQSPNSGVLNFALGNVYAGRFHWQPALKYFKRAVMLEPYNPDFSYNLGIAYDQVGMRQEALLRYKSALDFSWGKNVNFSREVVQKRIMQLEKGGG